MSDEDKQFIEDILEVCKKHNKIISPWGTPDAWDKGLTLGLEIEYVMTKSKRLFAFFEGLLLGKTCRNDEDFGC